MSQPFLQFPKVLSPFKTDPDLTLALYSGRTSTYGQKDGIAADTFKHS